MGMSRSATVVIAYRKLFSLHTYEIYVYVLKNLLVMKSQRIQFFDALERVKRVRPIVNPNPGFRLVLMRYEGVLELVSTPSADSGGVDGGGGDGGGDGDGELSGPTSGRAERNEDVSSESEKRAVTLSPAPELSMSWTETTEAT